MDEDGSVRDKRREDDAPDGWVRVAAAKRYGGNAAKKASLFLYRRPLALSLRMRITGTKTLSWTCYLGECGH